MSQPPPDFEDALGDSESSLPLGTRSATIQILRRPVPAGGTRVLICGSLPFEVWPLGGLLVVDGLLRDPSGTTSVLSDKVLMTVW
jgi:hypothetical protein